MLSFYLFFAERLCVRCVCGCWEDGLRAPTTPTTLSYIANTACFLAVPPSTCPPAPCPFVRTHTPHSKNSLRHARKRGEATIQQPV